MPVICPLIFQLFEWCLPTSLFAFEVVEAVFYFLQIFVFLTDFTLIKQCFRNIGTDNVFSAKIQIRRIRFLIKFYAKLLIVYCFNRVIFACTRLGKS
jgi:hypothetical protein